MRGATALVFAIAAAACSPAADTSAGANGSAAAPESATHNLEPTAGPSAQNLDAPVLSATGFGPYEAGEHIDDQAARLNEAERTSEDCRLFSDVALPGVWFMSDGAGIIQRISVGPPSAARAAGGIALGSDEAIVRAAYPAARIEPHEYTIGGSNVYTATASSSGLRFELDSNGKVTEMHGGFQPFLSYSEGCA